MCSACMTIAPVGVEQGRGRVAALLDVGRMGRAHQHRAHLLAGGAQRAQHHLEGDRADPAHASRSRTTASASAVARQPGGTTSVAPSSSKTAGPVELRLAGAEHARLGLLAGEHDAAGAALVGLGGGARARLRPGSGRRDADGHELQLGVLVRVSVAGLVRLVERLAQGGHGRAGRGFHRELEGLARVAEVVGHAQLGALVTQVLPCARRQPLERGAAALRRELRSAEEHALHHIAPALREHEAERGQHAARVGHDHAAHPQLAGDLRRVQRSRAPEGDQGEVARVDAPLDRHDPHRGGHLAVRHPHDSERGLNRREAQLPGQRGDGPLGSVPVQGHVAGQRRSGVEAAEQQVRRP